MKKSTLSILSEDPELSALLQQKQMAKIMENLSKPGDVSPFLLALKTVFQGEPGYSPKKGEDFFTEEEIEEFRKAVSPRKFEDYFTDEEIEWVMNQVFESVVKELKAGLKEELRPVKGVDYDDGEPGKDAEPVNIKALTGAVLAQIPKSKDVNFDEIINKVAKKLAPSMITVEDVVKELKEKKLLELRDIKGARLDGKASGGFNMNDQRWHGAGGTTSGGANVTTQYLLTAVQDGDNVTIDLNQLANFSTFDQLLVLYRNNIPQTVGASYNFTRTGNIVTVFNADASEIYNLTYSYA